VITLTQALANGTGTERKFSCPVHHDTNPSASVNVVKGKWFCYVCHAHGTLDGAVYDDLDAYAILDTITAMLDEPESEYHSEGWLDQFDAGRPCEYWLARFEPETVAHFRLGYDAVKDAATYPLRSPAGNLIGVVRRDLVGTSTKYRYPYRTRTTDLLFNYGFDQVEQVLLTEGATDAMAAWEAGYTPENGSLAVACFSNRLSAHQTWLLNRISPERIVVCFDDDEAGRVGVAQVQQALAGEYPVFRAVFGGAKDLAELSPDLRRKSVRQAIAL
jgi:DNA primase